MPDLGTTHVKANSRHGLRLHPQPARLMHWVNAGGPRRPRPPWAKLWNPCLFGIFNRQPKQSMLLNTTWRIRAQRQ
jgi:hypothetical protein